MEVCAKDETCYGLEVYWKSHGFSINKSVKFIKIELEEREFFIFHFSTPVICLFEEEKEWNILCKFFVWDCRHL